MNNQYLQWVGGSNRGNVEPVELTQDSQTFQDFAVLSNGQRLPMSKLGVDFIIIPNSADALSKIDLDIMYPIQRTQPVKKNKQQIPEHHSAILGLDEPVTEKSEPPKQRNHQKSFASDLLSRAKKINDKVPFELEIEIPSRSFFKMINETFDESTIDEIIDIIADSIDKKVLRETIKKSIINIYGDRP
jgi:hypothetical protein